MQSVLRSNCLQLEGFVKSVLVKGLTICSPAVDHQTGTSGVRYLKSILSFESELFHSSDHAQNCSQALKAISTLASSLIIHRENVSSIGLYSRPRRPLDLYKWLIFNPISVPIYHDLSAMLTK